ncbi:hypothetical protein N7493_006028 [Penicillium malachiteum]|uniref:NWD NACHT-NTPase N-terminal domain-containing protein n=1 Tax=Penicillium malachiteum TaxID=1324776 RepID=A0AAD6MVZ0_9EURO|nr:hypothetical protein N7493_006028 [Penicillium malachiteum]
MQKEMLQKSRLKFNVAGKEVVVKEQVHRALKSILSVNNFITTAVSSNPHASLAWAGVLVLLNPIAQSATQDEDAMHGFERIAGLLARYRVMEESRIQVHFSNSVTDRADSTQQLSSSIRSQTVQLYTERFLEDVVAVDNWNEMIQTITDLEKCITDDLRVLSDQTLQDIEKKINELQNDLGGLLDVASEARDEAKAAKQAEQLNSLSYAQNAAFNTYESQQKSGCQPETQVDMLRKIKAWCESPDGEGIYWLNGMAGTGKSTISYTLAAACCNGEALVDDAPLSDSVFIGASFFFKHYEPDQNNGKKLFTTICRQLSDLLPEVRGDICNSISSHSNISNEVMSNQWEYLILRPLLALEKRGLVPLNFIVVIDALDEGLPEDASTFIRVITEAEKLNNIRLRFFVTSRPEPHLTQWFDHCRKGSVSKTELPKVTVKDRSDSPNFKNDITRFLEVEMAKIGTSHEAPNGWPGKTAIQNLTLKSDGLFIYAATACRFLNESGRNRRSLQYRMDIIFNDKLVTKSPGGDLSSMYRKILMSSIGENSIEEERIDLYQRFKQVVGSIIMLCDPLSPNDLSNILGCPKEDIAETLDGLSSVLSKGEDDKKPIYLLHLSFRDFLLDQTCDEEFRIDSKIAHTALFEECLRVMAGGLRRNMCSFEDESVIAESIQPSLVNLHIPKHVQYACQYWVDHLRKSEIATLSENDEVHRFLKKYFLYWLEAMSLMGKMSEGVQAVLHLHEYISGLPSEVMPGIRGTVHDARPFVLSFAGIISHSPLQVYISALIYAPERSVIRTQFQHEIPKSIIRFPEVEKDWSPLLQTIPDYRESYSLKYCNRANLAFSPDGKTIASPSVCLWDVNTGILLKRFDPPGEPKFVAFSDNGERVIALSMEGNVREWDVVSGALVHEVMISAGGCLTTLSDDKTTMASYFRSTVQVIAIATQRVILSFQIHSERQGDLQLSQDNRLLACGFDDGSVQLWDTDTGEMKYQLLSNKSSPVAHVAFSRDGTFLSSLSIGGTLLLWDTDTGSLLKTFQESVNDAVFSADSEVLLYTGQNHLFFWDLESGTLAKSIPSELVGLRLSPDGKLVTSIPIICERLNGWSASPLDSNLIKVWDTASGELVNILGTHSDTVLDVIFSPDAWFMASYGCDETVRLWEMSASSYLDKREKNGSGVISMILSATLGVISLSISSAKMFKVWDLGVQAYRQQAFSARSDAQISLTADSRFLIESTRNEIVISEIATGKRVRSINHEENSQPDFSLCSQAKILGKYHVYAAYFEDGDDKNMRDDMPLVKVWDLDTGALLHTLYGPREKTIQLKFSPDGRFLALHWRLEGIGIVIEIWDVNCWHLHQTFEQTKATRLLDFVWSPDGAMIGILFEKSYLGEENLDKSTIVRQFDICDVNSGVLVTLFERRFDLHPAMFPYMFSHVFSAFSRDGKLVTTNPFECLIQLWNVKTGQMIGQRELKSSGEYPTPSMEDDIPISFSEDSQTLITRDGRLDIRSFDPHWDGVGSQDLFVDDGWVFQGPKKIMLLPHDYRPTCVLAVENTLVMGHASGHVTFLTLAPQDSSQ